MSVNCGGSVVVCMAEDFLQDFGFDSGLNGKSGKRVAAIVRGHTFDAEGSHEIFPVALCEIGVGVVAWVGIN